MATQEPVQESEFGTMDTQSQSESGMSSNQSDGGMSEAMSGDEMTEDFEEILLPASMREGLDELATALRNVVRTQPLVMLGAAAGVAYIVGRLASKK